jgi:predicted XRE-type DNA-binding protein
MESTKVTKAGNVFSDLGFSPAEARSLRIRSELMTALRKLIEKRGWTQAEAAERLKVSQPRVADLTRGKISRFSLDALVNMLTDVGMDVDLKVRRSSRRVA